MSKPGRCEHVLVYERCIGGYNIICRKCGELRGGSESADPAFLAGLNRNQRRANAPVRRAAKRAKTRAAARPKLRKATVKKSVGHRGKRS